MFKNDITINSFNIKSFSKLKTNININENIIIYDI